MPESRHRYLFERLGDHDFQQLVSAVLASQFPTYTPMALRQSDGGRDGLDWSDSAKVLVYQVKWSLTGTEKNSVSWLDDVVRNESANLKRLASEGVRRYVLVTNVPSTSKSKTGTYDRLEAKLQQYAVEYGFEAMTCAWRETLNAWVDNAPVETKWSYADMLAGWDLIRYLIAEQVGASKDQGVRAVVRKVAAAQWEEDERVKFSQSDVDRERVVDLFVDVHADRVRTLPGELGTTLPLGSVGGAAEYLLNAAAPFTLVRGAPGQGKSTLSQYVSQAHRAAFVPEKIRPGRFTALPNPRFPIRCDLSDYARWLDGIDPWDISDTSPRRQKRPAGNKASIECFLAAFITHACGGIPIDAAAVQDLVERVPSLIVLDGLDEVGSATMRDRVVGAIDMYVSRGRAYQNPPRVLVTTRPSAGELPEPGQQWFEVLALDVLTREQRAEYLRRWCAVREIRGRDGRALRKNFVDRSKEPFIDELAGNPMQLTILLDLLHKHGLATPTQRTELYDEYVALLLAREANKHPDVVRRYREELLEIIPFLGWYLQAHSEDSTLHARMSIAELKAAMLHFQRAYGNPESVVSDLFVAASDRLWALTSKTEGSYEFEVLSLREYFAARFLYRNAGEDQARFDRTNVLRELLRRPYWLNTARFYAGNAQGSDIYAIAAGVMDELRETISGPPFLAAWALLTDGVFQRRPREARNVLTALCADQGLPILLLALTQRDITPLAQLPAPEGDGPDPTWHRLTHAIATDPADPKNVIRVAALRELLSLKPAFADWWVEETESAAGTSSLTPWLALAARCEAAAGHSIDLPPETLQYGDAEYLLNAGAVPEADSDLADALLEAVWNGECPNVTSLRSRTAQIAVAFSPRWFVTTTSTAFPDSPSWPNRRRNDAINHLRKAGSPLAGVARRRVFNAGEKNSTFPWANTATALFDQVGRRWLVTQIAMLGAASPHQLGYSKQAGRAAFGPQGHPSELIALTRKHSRDEAWWDEQLVDAADDAGRAEWSFALYSVASGGVLNALFDRWADTINALEPRMRRRVLDSCQLVAGSGWLADRPMTIPATGHDLRELVEIRDGRPTTRDAQVLGCRSGAALGSRRPPSLLSVARASNWLKVDNHASYR